MYLSSAYNNVYFGHSTHAESPKRAMALYAFQAETDNELTINEGDELLVLGAAEGDWLMVQCRGKQGLVPAAYVEYL